MDWQPIETVPKDGTEFVAFIRHNVGGATRISVASAPAHLTPTSRFAWWYVKGGTACPIVETHQDVSDCWIITHWMPLPPAPESER